MTSQLDVFRHSDAALAAAYREAARTARLNPYEPEEKAERLKPLIERMKTVLGDRVKDVSVTTRLTESPVCLALPRGAHHPPVERLLRASGQKVPPTKRVFEVNPDSPVIETLLGATDDEWIELLYEQAILAEGGKLEDPARFARRVTRLLEKVTAPAK